MKAKNPRQWDYRYVYSAEIEEKKFALHFGGYDVINACTLLIHLVKLTKFTLGPIVSKVMIEFTRSRYQIKSHKCLLLISYDTWYSISVGNILKQNCLAFPQFLRYDGEINMIYHAWMEYDNLKMSRRWNGRFGF